MKEKVKENGLNIISHKEFEKEVHEEFVVFALVANKLVESSLDEPPKKTREVLKEFLDIFLFKLPDVLPLTHDIQYAIDFIPDSILPNLPHYMMNPSKHVKIKRQVNELLQKIYIGMREREREREREFESLCNTCPFNT
jgi:hypothetical protein